MRTLDIIVPLVEGLQSPVHRASTGFCANLSAFCEPVVFGLAPVWLGSQGCAAPCGDHPVNRDPTASPTPPVSRKSCICNMFKRASPLTQRMVMEADSPLPVRMIEESAEDGGLSWRTVQSAKGILGIKSLRIGFGGSWIWCLSRDHEQAAKNAKSAKDAHSAESAKNVKVRPPRQLPSGKSG
jgi:hypothetical protein